MTDNTWQPLKTLPKAGTFLLASYAPTNWAYWVITASFNANDTPRQRENRLKYARAWMRMPPEPYEGINGLHAEVAEAIGGKTNA